MQLLWKFSLLLFFLAWGTIFISHKVAGPFFRFSKAFNEVERGDYRSRVTLRKLDEGHPIAQEFNEAMEKTDHLLSSLKVLTQEKDASQAVAKIREKLSAVQTDEQATKTMLSSYQSLLVIATKRLQAIRDNRTILIAGLQVVNVPGTENLNLIQTPTGSQQGGAASTGLPMGF